MYWIVYSDRDNNKFYSSINGSVNSFRGSLMQSFFVKKTKNNSSTQRRAIHFQGAARAAARRAPDPNASRSLPRGARRRRRRASAAARTTTTDPRAQTLALRPRLGLVLWGLAGLEERPERGVVLPEGLSIVLAPGPRGLARVDDGRAGLHLLVLPVGED